MPRDPSSQAIILFNAMKTWTFFELVLRGNMPSINESAPTMITYFYENRITLSATISLVLGVLAASYASKKCQRNFCAVVGACYVAEEAIGRLTFLSGQVTFTHVWCCSWYPCADLFSSALFMLLQHYCILIRAFIHHIFKLYRWSSTDGQQLDQSWLEHVYMATMERNSLHSLKRAHRRDHQVMVWVPKIKDYDNQI